MNLRLLNERDLQEAIALIWSVFEEFEVPIYPPKGIKSFQEFISYDNILAMYHDQVLIFWGCFFEDQLVGVIALRGISHISLLFVRKEWHHKGIATYLFKTVLGYAITNNQCDLITVNSSPYAVGFYKTVGFRNISGEKVVDGIRFFPMEYRVTTNSRW